MDYTTIKTIGDLRAAGYKTVSVRDELRNNLITKIKNKETLFEGIIGYEDTVIPELQNALLSRHDFILLGLRGQAKTRILRSLTDLLDPLIPIISGCDINDHPFHPVCKSCRDKIAKNGDGTEIEWIDRSTRFNEKLATPDVSIADLFGDIDPIKAANKRLHYAHEEAIHYGIIPRTNRGIFVINELPDLQPRIQVGLLNILEEKDLQIRGFPIRIPLDILIAFSANPEDYTNRGSIITPLKDRIDSQIITHYPQEIDQGIQITRQESWESRDQIQVAEMPYFFREIIESLAMEARSSELIDQKSGVSARLPISCMENLISNAERRALRNGESETAVRISDLKGVIPAITGKIELVYEGEQEGITNVAQILLGKAISRIFKKYFPQPKNKQNEKVSDPELENVLAWFANDRMVTINSSASDAEFIKALQNGPPLDTYIKKYFPAEFMAKEINLAVVKEFVLEALHQTSFLSKYESNDRVSYKDLVESIFNSLPDDDERDLNYFA